MKLNKQTKRLTISLLLVSTVLMGCASTDDLNGGNKTLKTTPPVNVDSRIRQQVPLAKNETIQDIQNQIKQLENTVKILNANNVRLSKKSKRYEKVSNQNKSNSLATAKLQNHVKQLKFQLAQLNESSSSAISALKEKWIALDENIKQLNKVVNNKDQGSLINRKKVNNLSSTVDDLNQLIKKSNSDLINYQNSSDIKHKSDIKSLWIGLIALLVLMLGVLISFVLFRKTTKAELSNTKHNLDSECNKLDLKLTELLESQVEMMALVQTPSATAEQDHSIPFKVLTELHRMKGRLAKLPSETKGLKPLGKAIERIEESLHEKGYEMVELLNQPYVDGMTVNQEYLFDENLSPEERIISKVVTPQINYNGVVTQVADVIVSIGE